MLILEQWTDEDRVTPSLRFEFKARVTRALATQELCVDKIANQMFLVVSRGRKRPLCVNGKRLFYAMVNNIINPHHKVFMLVRDHIRRIIHSSCMSTLLKGEMEDNRCEKLDVIAVRKAGLLHVQDELLFVAGKFTKLWGLHWRVHEDLYLKLVSQK
jgi:hypothetical protein